MEKGDDVIKVKSPCGALRLVAAIFGQDPRKILNKYGISPSKKHIRCENCGNYFVPSKQVGFLKDICPECRIKNVKLVCDECGNILERPMKDSLYRLSELSYRHVFCDRTCLGRYAGKHYGFAVHPENIVLGRNRRRIDPSIIIALRKEGKKYREIALVARCSVCTVSNVLKSNMMTKGVRIDG